MDVPIELPGYCDRCGPAVRARVIVSLPSGSILTYCRHCATRFHDNIKLVGGFLYPLGDEE